MGDEVDVSRGRKPKYPWAEWADGEEHTIKAEVDFTIDPEVMVAQIRHYAWRNRKRSSVVVVGDTVTFQFSEREE